MPTQDPFVWDRSVTMAWCFDDEARTSRFFPLREAAPIVIDDETSRRAFAGIVHLARAHQLSAYDAAYPERAIRRGLPLACLDGKRKAAAIAAGVVLLGPAWPRAEAFHLECVARVFGRSFTSRGYLRPSKKWNLDVGVTGTLC